MSARSALRLLARILCDSAAELLAAQRLLCGLLASAALRPRLRAALRPRSPSPPPPPSLAVLSDPHVLARVLSLLPERSDVLAAALTCRAWHTGVRAALSAGALALPPPPAPPAPAPRGALRDTPRSVLLVLWALAALAASASLPSPWASLALASSALLVEVALPPLLLRWGRGLRNAPQPPRTYLVCVRTEPDAECILALCPLLVGLRLARWSLADAASHPAEWAAAALLCALLALGYREAFRSRHSRRVLRRALLTCTLVPALFCGLCAVLWWPLTAAAAAGMQGFVVSVAWPVVSHRVVGGTQSIGRYTSAGHGGPPDSASGVTMGLLALLGTREMLGIAGSPGWFTAAAAVWSFLLAAGRSD
eukprot:m51a1_g7171 hypothetical protein (366) ;mRNA; r:64787-65884